jgi:hypothetical protein
LTKVKLFLKAGGEILLCIISIFVKKIVDIWPKLRPNSHSNKTK